jgi:hypothetical protein
MEIHLCVVDSSALKIELLAAESDSSKRKLRTPTLPVPSGQQAMMFLQEGPLSVSSV